jgi:hypothetical protein
MGLDGRVAVAEWWCRRADGWADGLALALGVAVLARLVGRLVGVAEPVPADENGVGVAEGDDPVQAETDAEASMVKVAQPTRVNFALTPVLLLFVRIFTGPPHAFGRGQERVPVPGSEEKSRASYDARCARRPNTDPGRAGRHKGNAHRRHRHAMTCSSLEY